MISEISIAIIAGSVVVLVIFLVATLLKTQKALFSAKKDLHSFSNEAVQLMDKLDRLAADIQSKSDSLNFMFRPLKSLNKEQHHHRKDHGDTVREIAEWVGTSLILFDKIKTAVKHHER